MLFIEFVITVYYAYLRGVYAVSRPLVLYIFLTTQDSCEVRDCSGSRPMVRAVSPTSHYCIRVPVSKEKGTIRFRRMAVKMRKKR